MRLSAKVSMLAAALAVAGCASPGPEPQILCLTACGVTPQPAQDNPPTPPRVPNPKPKS